MTTFKRPRNDGPNCFYRHYQNQKMTIPHQGIGRGRLVPSSHKGSKFRYTIVREFSRGDERIREDIPVPDSLGKETFLVGIFTYATDFFLFRTVYRCMIYFLSLSFLKHKIFVCLYIFRDPNRPVPVRMFWPLFTEEEQLYLHITRNMTSDSVKNSRENTICCGKLFQE